MNSIHRIAHLDMDAFFASVELFRYPELLGKAVLVGGRKVHYPVEQPDGTKRFARLKDYAGRVVITTSIAKQTPFRNSTRNSGSTHMMEPNWQKLAAP